MFSKNKYFKANQRILKRAISQIDPDAVIKEITSLHTTRGLSSTKRRDFFKDNSRVIDASLDEISKRSRLTTLKLSCLKIKSDVEIANSNLRKYLLSKYAPKLKSSGHTTQTAQRAYVEQEMKESLSFVKSLDMVMDMCDIVINDIDQAGWGLKRIQASLEQASRDR